MGFDYAFYIPATGDRVPCVLVENIRMVGYDPTDPNLDALAAGGMRFKRCFTSAPVCSPSRSAFMTGMYSTTIGAHNHRSNRDGAHPLPDGVRLLTDWMRDEELYDTLADPHEIKNLAASGHPEHQTARKHLRTELEKWIEDSNDRGRIPEPVTDKGTP